MLVLLLNQLTGGCAASHSLCAAEKITLRAGLAAVLSFVLAVMFGPKLIAWLRLRFREPIKCPSDAIGRLHQAKQWTPTMGGLFIVGGLVGASLVFGDFTNPYVAVTLLTVLGLAALGAIDDLVKLRTNSSGISAGTKFTWQLVIATVAALVLYRLHSRTPDGLDLSLPMLGPILSLGWLFVPLSVLVIVASSNAVNLTDGLDGLAGGCLIFATGSMAAMVYASGHAEWSAYLRIAQIPGAGELAVVAAGALGGLLGFLWFNCFPASVFMGNTGALPLGGLLGVLAIIARQELLLVVVGGVFVAEALSVILQVCSCRWLGRRVFLCAPLHHHFQLRGWPENRIVVRFWIASALCGILGLAALKLGLKDPMAARDQQLTRYAVESDRLGR